MKDKLLLLNTSKAILIALLVTVIRIFSSCENYIRWDLQEIVRSTYPVMTCDSVYIWIDGNAYTTDNNEATFIVSGNGSVDTLYELDLVFFIESDTMKIWTCDEYTWIDGNVYSESNNTATYWNVSSQGCDSLVVLDLTIGPLQGVDAINACGSYTWIDGNTYTQSNNSATHILTTANGCDSIVTLNLTIVPLQGIENITACDSYTWIDGNTYFQSNNSATYVFTTVNGCDSVVNLNLTILNSTYLYDSVVTCGPYTWINGITYANNNYNAFVNNTGPNGCDETTYLHLTMDCECSVPPNFGCNITTSTTGQNYSIGISGLIFTPGQSVVVTMNSPVYSFGQAKNVSLYCNETLVHNYGNWLVFSSNTRSFNIPANTNPDNCFTIRVTKEGPTVSASDDLIWVSNAFQIQ